MYPRQYHSITQRNNLEGPPLSPINKSTRADYFGISKVIAFRFFSGGQRRSVASALFLADISPPDVHVWRKLFDRLSMRKGDAHSKILFIGKCSWYDSHQVSYHVNT